MKELFDDDETEAVILVDASIAFLTPPIQTWHYKTSKWFTHQTFYDSDKHL